MYLSLNKTQQKMMLLVLGFFAVGAVSFCASYSSHHSVSLDATNGAGPMTTITGCCTETQQYRPIILPGTTIGNNALNSLNLITPLYPYLALIFGMVLLGQQTKRLEVARWVVIQPANYLREAFSRGILHPRIYQSIYLKTS